MFLTFYYEIFDARTRHNETTRQPNLAADPCRALLKLLQKSLDFYFRKLLAIGIQFRQLFWKRLL